MVIFNFWHKLEYVEFTDHVATPFGTLHWRTDGVVCVYTAVNWVLEKEQGLYYATGYSYAFGQKRNRVIFEVTSVFLVLNEGHDSLPNSISAIAEMTIFAMDVVLWFNFPPNE